jgi:endonuclease/exonuclease/phosphatase (EEP) superfamily protein YafD
MPIFTTIWLDAAALLAMAALIFSSLAGFFGRQWWLFDLFSHFRHQYLILLAVLSLALLLLGEPLRAAITLLFSLINLAVILPLYLKRLPPKEVNPSPRLRLLLANVLQPNSQYAKAIAVIEAEKPDIIVLVEVNPAWIEALSSALEPYPHRLLALRTDHYGLAIFSRCPIKEGRVVQLPGLDIPTLAASFELDSQPAAVIAAHPPPPKSAYLAEQRNIQFSALADFAASLPGHILLAGDLNSSSWSPHFKNLIRRSGLRDSREGFGLQPTWPTDRPFFLTPIDHILVSRGICVHSRHSGSSTGSDHYPVILDFSLSKK